MNQLHHDIQHGGGDQKTVPVQAIDLDGVGRGKTHGGQIVSQGRAALGADFQQPRFCKTRMNRVGGTEQFQRRAHAGRRHVFRFNLSSADDKNVVLLGRNVERVARVYQAHRPQQRDLGRVHTEYLATHAAHAGPLGFGAQAPAVKDPVRLAALSWAEVFG